MKAGFIGLGHLGKAIASRLFSQGVELVVWNRTLEKARVSVSELQRAQRNRSLRFQSFS
jgi:3-hydroxyisobutyrate dehydrogenase-like beta-hydroxyacid dehydrogenase